ncbi:MAG TPA: PQQ-binding-like beta-propeller repeat protein [Gemmataceae bacterium]|nr:PQQ-binding-like beta-propeller repeat protein [Gemmataceae bacterium]
MRPIWFVLFVAVCSKAAVLHGDDWPQWRGPGRDSVWRTANLPDRLPADRPAQRWKQSIGGGYGGIAVAGGRVYVMDRQKEPREIERVLCLDAATGNRIWDHEYAVNYDKMDYGNGPRSTPTVYADRVYTFGAVGHLRCFDATTGKLIWDRNAVRDLNARIPTWGHACSPLVDGDRLVVQIGGKNACLVAFDRATGKEVWKALPDRPGYSSPVLVDGKAGRLLVYWTAEHLNGLDPATGKVRWQVPHTTEYDVTISDPVCHDGVLLVGDYWTGGFAVKLDVRDENPKKLWQGRQASLLMSTPLIRAGHVYALDKDKGLTCIEIATGKVKWDGEFVTPRGRNPQASLVWAGERALIFNELGELILARLSPEGFQEISKTPILENGTWANPAYAGNCIFARNDKEIVCVPLLKFTK